MSRADEVRKAIATARETMNDPGYQPSRLEVVAYLFIIEMLLEVVEVINAELVEEDKG